MENESFNHRRLNEDHNMQDWGMVKENDPKKKSRGLC
jgi:hypothetical protein